MLRQLGAGVIDADGLAHEAMRKGTAAYRELVRSFGDGILDEAGEIDRRKLGAIVFSDPQALARLDQAVHPAVVKRAGALVKASEEPVVVIEAIKLLESGVRELCDAVWVVTCPRDQQVRRLLEVRGLTREEAERRIDAQPKQEAKLAVADVIIDNGGKLESTRRQVEHHWRAITEPPPARPAPAIRRATPEDLPAILGFLALLYPEGEAPEADRVSPLLDRWSWVAVRDDRVVGWIAMETSDVTARVVDWRMDPLEEPAAVMNGLLIHATKDVLRASIAKLRIHVDPDRNPLWWMAGRQNRAPRP